MITSSLLRKCRVTQGTASNSSAEELWASSPASTDRQTSSWHSQLTTHETTGFFLVVYFFLPPVDLKNRVPVTVLHQSPCDLVQRVPPNSKQWVWHWVLRGLQGERLWTSKNVLGPSLDWPYHFFWIFFTILGFSLSCLVHFFPL